MEFRFADSAGFAQQSKECDLVALVVTREEVERGSIGDVVDRLMHLTDSTENVLKFESSLVLSFTGYDEDTRPLWRIPECVAFFRAVHRTWPYWLHFLIKEPSMFGVLLGMLVECTPLTTGIPGTVAGSIDMGEASNLIASLFTPMNSLYLSHGIGMKANKRMTDEVCDVISRCLS